MSYKPKVLEVASGGTGSATIPYVATPPNASGFTIGSDTFKQTAMYMLTNAGNSSATGAFATVDRIYFYPALIPVTGTYTKLGCIITAGTALSHCRVGIYNTSSGFPSTVLAQTASLDTSTGGIKETTGLSFTITAGWYWIGVTIDVAGATFRKMPGSLVSYAALPVGAADISVNSSLCYYDNAYGSLPTITQASLVLGGVGSVIFFYIA